MRAAFYTGRSPAAIELRDVEQPVPKDDEVLIRVRAAGLNALDHHLGRMAGWRRAKNTRVGVDLAGVVEAIGKNVTQFKVGDAVVGNGKGTLAEFVCTAEAMVVPKPEDLTFDEAAAIPVAGFTALQGLRDQARVQPGQKVLINGAGGGVGTFAVQIAKALGADVNAVCGTHNVDLIHSLGADLVIDYTREDFIKRNERYDLIFNNAGPYSLSTLKRVLTPNGVVLLVGIAGGRFFTLLSNFIRASLGSRRARICKARQSRQTLLDLLELIKAGRIRPIIDRTFPLSEAAEAFRYFGGGHLKGKVVVTN